MWPAVRSQPHTYWFLPWLSIASSLQSMQIRSVFKILILWNTYLFHTLITDTSACVICLSRIRAFYLVNNVHCTLCLTNFHSMYCIQWRSSRESTLLMNAGVVWIHSWTYITLRNKVQKLSLMQYILKKYNSVPYLPLRGYITLKVHTST